MKRKCGGIGSEKGAEECGRAANASGVGAMRAPADTGADGTAACVVAPSADEDEDEEEEEEDD